MAAPPVEEIRNSKKMIVEESWLRLASTNKVIKGLGHVTWLTHDDLQVQKTSKQLLPVLAL